MLACCQAARRCWCWFFLMIPLGVMLRRHRSAIRGSTGWKWGQHSDLVSSGDATWASWVFQRQTTWASSGANILYRYPSEAAGVKLRAVPGVYPIRDTGASLFPVPSACAVPGPACCAGPLKVLYHAAPDIVGRHYRASTEQSTGWDI